MEDHPFVLIAIVALFIGIVVVAFRRSMQSDRKATANGTTRRTTSDDGGDDDFDAVTPALLFTGGPTNRSLGVMGTAQHATEGGHHHTGDDDGGDGK